MEGGYGRANKERKEGRGERGDNIPLSSLKEYCHEQSCSAEALGRWIRPLQSTAHSCYEPVCDLQQLLHSPG